MWLQSWTWRQMKEFSWLEETSRAKNRALQGGWTVLRHPFVCGSQSCQCSLVTSVFPNHTSAP